MWLQREIRLRARERGFHLVTDEIVRQLPELERFEVGLAHLFIQHTSASLTINENADPTVRQDFESVFHCLVPQDEPSSLHTPYLSPQRCGERRSARPYQELPAATHTPRRPGAGNLVEHLTGRAPGSRRSSPVNHHPAGKSPT